MSTEKQEKELLYKQGFKQCSDCGVIKTLNQYNKRSDRKYGQSKCKKCYKKTRDEYRLTHKEKIANQQKQYNIKNAKTIKKQRRQYNRDNQETISIQCKQYRLKNKESIKKQSKIYSLKNKEKIKKYQKQWIEQNRKHHRQHQNEYQKSRRKNDPVFVLKQRISWSLRKSLNNIGISKDNKPTFDILNYSQKYFANHMLSYVNQPCERCKLTIITINNSQIDHIKPVSMAKTELDVIWLNQLSNLRLICTKCNREKSDHLEFSPPDLSNISFMVKEFSQLCNNMQ